MHTYRLRIGRTYYVVILSSDYVCHVTRGDKFVHVDNGVVGNPQGSYPHTTFRPRIIMLLTAGVGEGRRQAAPRMLDFGNTHPQAGVGGLGDEIPAATEAEQKQAPAAGSSVDVVVPLPHPASSWMPIPDQPQQEGKGATPAPQKETPQQATETENKDSGGVGDAVPGENSDEAGRTGSAGGAQPKAANGGSRGDKPNAQYYNTCVRLVVPVNHGGSLVQKMRDGRLQVNEDMVQQLREQCPSAKIIKGSACITRRNLVMEFSDTDCAKRFRLLCHQELMADRAGDGTGIALMTAPVEYCNDRRPEYGGLKEKSDRLVFERVKAGSEKEAVNLVRRRVAGVLGAENTHERPLIPAEDRYTEEGSANASQQKTCDAVGMWRVYVICFGEENARKAAVALHKSTEGWEVAGETMGTRTCDACGAFGHFQRDCPQRKFVLRIDSFTYITYTHLEQIAAYTGATHYVAGVRRNNNWRNFGHLFYQSEEEMLCAQRLVEEGWSEATLFPKGDLVITCAMPSTSGIRKCCGDCGLIGDHHKAGDRRKCPSQWRKVGRSNDPATTDGRWQDFLRSRPLSGMAWVFPDKSKPHTGHYQSKEYRDFCDAFEKCKISPGPAVSPAAENPRC